MHDCLDIASPNKKEINNFDDDIIVDYFDKVLVSSLNNKNLKGCKKCLLERFINTRKDRIFVQQSNKNVNYKKFDLFEHLISKMLDFIKDDEQLVDNFGRRKFLILDKNNFSISSSYYLPVPDCKVCGNLPDDTEELIKSSFEKVLHEIESRDSIPFRKTDKKVLCERLESLILNKDVGIVTILMDSCDGPFPIAVATLPLENGRDESGSGRTNNIEDSRTVALLEAIERYAGFRPRGKETKIFDTYDNLKSLKSLELLDVSKIILHENSLSKNSEYKNKHYKFSTDKKYHWIYGYNLIKKKAVLLPETLGYYGLTMKNKSYIDETFVYEISNGCSVGSSLLESSYYGLLEVIERDAFLTSWYTSRTINKIILDDKFLALNHKLKTEIEIFSNFYSDFKIDIYDITTDICVPTVLMTMTRKNIDKEKFNFMCSAASDFNICIAVEKALHEISGIFLGFQEKFKKDYKIIKQKSENLTLIKDMLDHSLVYGYYKNLGKINFESRIRKIYNISDYKNTEKINLNSCYKILLKQLSKMNKDVIIVDQTTEEMKKIDLFCSKTLVPGLLPMTFGAENIRISKERIRELEIYSKEKLEVRFIPHPFP